MNPTASNLRSDVMEDPFPVFSLTSGEGELVSVGDATSSGSPEYILASVPHMEGWGPESAQFLQTVPWLGDPYRIVSMTGNPRIQEYNSSLSDVILVSSLWGHSGMVGLTSNARTLESIRKSLRPDYIDVPLSFHTFSSKDLERIEKVRKLKVTPGARSIALDNSD